MMDYFLSENNFLIIFIFLTLIAFSVFVSDFLKKKNQNIKEEIMRKIPHVLIGIIFSISPFFMNKVEIITASIFLVLGILIGKYSPFFKPIFSIKRKTYGMWLTPLSLGIMAFLWLPKNILVFLFGMLVLTFSDALAALVGIIFGKKQYPFFKKTLLGSLAFFISTFLIVFALSPEIEIWNFLWISLTLTLFEFILIFGLDNLFLPIIASYLFYFILLN